MKSDARLTRVLAAAVLLAGGLGLLLLGGCFLIGIMVLLTGTGLGATPVTFAWTPPLYALLIALSIVAIACFAGAIGLILISLKALLRILNT
jgi:hypothetical protein